MADLHDNNVSLFPYPDSSYGSKAKNCHQDQFCPHNKTVMLSIFP